MKQPTLSVFSTVLLVIIVAVLAAITTSVVTNQSLERYAGDLEDRFAALQRGSGRPITLPGTYEEALATLETETMPALGYITAASTDVFLPGDQIATAVAITSDGWMFLTNGEAISVEENSVWIGEERYQINDIRRDAYSSAALLKIDAANMRAIAFGSSELAPSGSLLFSVSAARDVYPGSLESARLYQSEATEAEVLPYVWQVSDYLPEGLLFDAAGALIGWSEEAFAYPIHMVVPFVDATLRGRDDVYAGLGIEVQGGYVIGDSIGLTQAEVTAIAEGESVFETGDVLLRIDDIPLGAMTIGDVLLMRRPGETVVIDYLRGEEEMREVIELQPRSGLIY